MAEHLLIIDAMAWIFRSYYSEDDFRTPEGFPANASFGFLHFLLRNLSREKPNHAAVVFDSGPRCFRKDIYPAYKANRSETPEDLLPQFEQCERVTDALGLPRFKVDNYEADDVIASLAKLARKDDFEITILSGDKDLAQLVEEGVRIIDPGRNRRFTTRTVKKRFGVEPPQLLDWMSLVGDSSDNVPGMPGVGPKTATALIEEFGGLDEIYASLERIETLEIRGARTLAPKLEKHRDKVEMAKRLIRLESDLPLGISTSKLQYHGAPEGECRRVFEDLGFEASLPAVPLWKKEGE
ncbi:MAG: 5'-3' exonuclease H3TH domain-containing protein [Candidatus Krumholzibacteria bacterium]|jgi:DNA polymerase-1|nr:5'-3' exonuclease H3TH domain-containing protein [Candidatus Krumholzibacteria bacterium]MDP6669302.1 5'-3' exonuclease H3TH domain-containing protein [Candidatus Krumholzibacteria bacterium]MDP6797328.1 5'-3' exonuclease H3TH domain-containing protein [Candidatus Krumholzibacteria bacterium]MDP7021525.1 5'-3' exonuclease H3TH domain-containing protein [Candidatus Krumholzibacteria bacterium]